MNRFNVYNKSCTDMSEIPDNFINLVITDPPWNMGVKFGNQENRQSIEEYTVFISSVIKEIHRVITQNGLCVVMLAEKVQFKNQETNLPDLYKEIFSKHNFNHIKSIDVNFIEEEKSIFSIKKILGWNKYKDDKFYSKNGKILVFSKDQREIEKTDLINGNTFKFKETSEHPCATSTDMAKSLLDVFYEKGDRVLDPFMGTANIGVEVIAREGFFYGYELVKEYFDTAVKKLMSADLGIN